MPISSLPSILSLFSQQLSRLFIQGLTFLLLSSRLLWSCRRHIHFAAKDVFVVTTGHCPDFFFFFFAFLVVVLIVIFTPSCCSYCHCSTGSNSHTVVLSKPCILLSSIVLCPRKKTQTHLTIFYGCVQYGKITVGVWLQYISECGKSTIKVRRKYAVSKAQVQLQYGISIVKYGKV